MKRSDNCTICRRLGEKLFLKGDKCNSPSCPFIKKGYAPGEAGPKSFSRKRSDYHLQLIEKQKVKAIYGLSESQMINAFKKARSADGQTGAKLITSFERRLDNVVLRCGFALSLDEARQRISHGKIYVNDKRMKSPSYQVVVGDRIQDKSVKSSQLKKIQSRWIRLSEGKAEIVELPNQDDIPAQIKEQLIVEYYSR